MQPSGQLGKLANRALAQQGPKIPGLSGVFKGPTNSFLEFYIAHKGFLGLKRSLSFNFVSCWFIAGLIVVFFGFIGLRVDRIYRL